jgi:hypothetical protein
MRQNTRVTFAMRDLDRLKCIQAVVDGDLQLVRTSERLSLTTRQVRRLARRLMQILFNGTESTFGYFEAARRYIEQHGKPPGFYSDKACIFRINHVSAMDTPRNRRYATKYLHVYQYPDGKIEIRAAGVSLPYPTYGAPTNCAAR